MGVKEKRRSPCLATRASLDAWGPMGRGIPRALRPKFGLEANLADKSAAIRVDLHEHDAAETAMGAHHITAMDEGGLPDHPVAMEAQGFGDARAVHEGAVLVAFMAETVMTVTAMVPGRRGCRTDTGGGQNRQGSC